MIRHAAPARLAAGTGRLLQSRPQRRPLFDQLVDGAGRNYQQPRI
jgi:hypothetical protein